MGSAVPAAGSWPVEGPQAEEMRRWGADPAPGRSLIDGLSDAFRVVAFDYEGHVLQVPKPDTLTPANVAGGPATPQPRLRSGREVKSVQDAVAASA